MSPLEATYLGISGYVFFWVLTVFAFGLFAYRISKLIRYMFLGQKEKSFGKLLRRGLTTTIITLGQWCQLKGITLKDKAGIGHVILAWGFTVFVVFYVTFIIIGAGFGLSESLGNSALFLRYSWIMDIIAWSMGKDLEKRSTRSVRVSSRNRCAWLVPSHKMSSESLNAQNPPPQ